MTNEIVAVITGITGDIGKSIALTLAKNGVRVFGFGYDATKSTQLEGQLQALMSSSAVHTVDFTKADYVQDLSRILSSLQRVDWVIHVAGFIDAEESFENLKNLNRTFQVNLFSIIELYKLSAPKLSEAGGIICISSTASLSGNGRTPMYATSKGALNTFAQSIAHSFRDGTKKSIVLCPGPTNTTMRENFAHDATKHQSPEIVANVVNSIIEETSPYKNGDVVVIRDNIKTLHSSMSLGAS